MKIDAHQHFWNYIPERDTWIDDSMRILQKDFLPTDLKAKLKSNSIDGCIAGWVIRVLSGIFFHEPIQLYSNSMYSTLRSVLLPPRITSLSKPSASIDRMLIVGRNELLNVRVKTVPSDVLTISLAAILTIIAHLADLSAIGK